MNLAFRVATAADVPALLGLIREYWAFEQIDGFDAKRVGTALAELLSQPEFGRTWIVEDGKRAAGYLIAVYCYSIEHAGLTAEIDELFVQSAYRGGGVGRRLLEMAESEFEAAGCTNVSFQIGRSNDAARRFYARCGYAARDGYDLMDKSLTPGRR